MNQNLQCLKPAIILNPRLKEIICLHGNYTFRGYETILTKSVCAAWCYDFPYGLFGTRKQNITLDDVDTCYVTDRINGELIPIYMVVPCNKCIICRDKSAREWSTRAMCEAQTSTGYPLFITLTYNDKCLPSDGVHKEHCQNFLKRLRINLNRYLGYDVNLRFFLCAEYGSKTKRPHYHVLLYNFPALDTLKRSLSIIEKSWSYVVTKDEADNVNNDYKFYDEHAKRWRVRYGYVHLQLAQGGHVKYAMKYMRKDCQKPKVSNDVFYLVSRKRGLGYEWLAQNMQEYYDNPQNYDVQFKDIWSQTICKFLMPTYFKNILYPCISRVIPKDIRVIYSNFVDCLNKRTAILTDIGRKPFIGTDEFCIMAKYRALPTYLASVGNYTWLPKMEPDNISYVDKQYQDNYLVDVHLVTLPYQLETIEEIRNDIYKSNEQKINQYKQILYDSICLLR